MRSKLKYFLTLFTCVSSLYLLVGCPHADEIKRYLQQQGIKTISYDNDRCFHVHFSGQTQAGNQWIVREVQEKDKEQLASLLAYDPHLEIEEEFTEDARLPLMKKNEMMPEIDRWIKKFEEGRVNSTLVIYEPDESQLIGAIVVGHGNGIAGALNFEIQLAKVGGQEVNLEYKAPVLGAFVNQFAREIYQLTYPQAQSNVARQVKEKLAQGFPGADPDPEVDLLEASPLETLYTISNNPTPMYRQAGFIAARFGPGATALEKLYDDNGRDHFTSVNALKACLQRAYVYSDKTADQEHYQLKLNGQDVTVSYQGGMVRYHWEYNIRLQHQ